MNSEEMSKSQNLSTTMCVVKRDGSREEVSFAKCQNRISKLTKITTPTLSAVNPIEIAQQMIIQISDGIPTKELDELAASICANKESIHPDYGKLASRIIITNHHKNTSPSFSEVVQTLWDFKDDNGVHTPLVAKYFLDLVLANKEKLNSVIDYQKDFNYSYFGFKTLERAYLIKINEKVIERPQHMLMRVAVAMHRDDIREAVKAYKMMSEGLYTPATPTLYNMGTNREQASSCFLLTMADDSVGGIYKTLSDCAKISKWAGGIGVSISSIRARGSLIRGTNGRSNGIVPMLKNFNETARYIDQGGGKRKGSFAMYLEPWHADIEDFLMLRRNTGAETERARDLFYAVWVPDIFMRKVLADEDWYLMCPDYAKGLQDTYGEEFENLYNKYVEGGKYKKKVKAREIWDTILDSQIETGTPYIGFKDAVNKKSNQQNLGVIRSSNLCIEVVEYTSEEETAVCNLSSIALPKFVETNQEGNLFYNFKKLEETTKSVGRNLNKIIDFNFYPIPEAEKSNRRHRPIGIGVQGLADVFALMRMPFDSKEAKELNKKIFAHIYFAAIECSMEISRKRKKHIQEYRKLKKLSEDKKLSEENKLSEEDISRIKELKKLHFIIDEELKLPSQYAGAYSTFINSPAHQGKLQFDLWGVEPIPELKERFDKLKEDIKKHGLRNSLSVALMPTASTSQILGNNECIEPYTSNIYKRRTLAGEFKLINQHLIKDLIDIGVWNTDIKDQIIMDSGSIQKIENIPDDVKNLYKIVWELSQKNIIDMASDRGAYVCQTQSMNLFMGKPTHKKLSSMHFHSWKSGLKTGIYYLRTLGAAQAQKFSIDANKLKKDAKTETPLFCTRDNPDCETCSA